MIFYEKAYDLQWLENLMIFKNNKKIPYC